MNSLLGTMSSRNSTNVMEIGVISAIVILYDFFSAPSRSTTITWSFADSSDVKSLPFVDATYWPPATLTALRKLIVIDSGSGYPYSTHGFSLVKPAGFFTKRMWSPVSAIEPEDSVSVTTDDSPATTRSGCTADSIITSTLPV